MAMAMLNRFTCFPKLPLEIQLMIWSLCPAATQKQLIKIEEVLEEDFRRMSTPSISPHVKKPFSETIPNENFIKVKYTVPSPLQVCRISRKLALAHYRRVPTTYGDVKDGSAPFYIDGEKDSILLTTLYRPDSDHPALCFLVFDGKTFSTLNGENFCTTVVTRWTSREPPTFEHALYIICRFPNAEHIYFLDCPFGPAPRAPFVIPHLQGLSRNNMEKQMNEWIKFSSELMSNPRVAAFGSDMTDVSSRQGVYASNWKMPLVSCVTSEEFHKL